MTLDLLSIYQDLHAHPELGFQEHRTAGVIADRLAEIGGITVTTGVGGTGVVGVLGNGDGPVLWLRADIDGLPVQERTGLPYASTHRGVDEDGNEGPTMHACGHDIHVTWLLGALERLVAATADWHGTVVAVFQPAEEVISGARAMIEDGLVDRFPKPTVVLGQHSAPAPVGVVAVGSGAVMASSDRFTVTFTGRGAHGSAPQASLDPIVTAASAVVRLQTIVSREVAPSDAGVVTVGSFHAGTRPNIIPDTAVIEISTRARNEETRARIVASIERIVRAESEAGGLAAPTIARAPGADVLVNDPEQAAVVLDAVRAVVPHAVDMESGLAMASEDVGQLATAAGAPIVYWFTGITDPELFRSGAEIPSNHSPFYAPQAETAIPVGVDALVAAARAYLS
ncbi:amidohydrolase [Curtobacterium sp. MCJR17_055]|uniref:amidohydrolase n=1 Tax=unclassified Curtobacterium TaxID=257496 RepID=UPI000D985D65|nr:MULTISPECIES: amidohydrolase [unclassified Curtobacterium]PYY36930.1 amidohydrolase [Curtobacterium sp. MCBD17_029]PYY57959.1 amidohydrolase [Curtobacterium sp. MCPF17_015]PYY58410.1 amidohydrolase [Curtobacterium sp. MCJR17_055]